MMIWMGCMLSVMDIMGGWKGFRRRDAMPLDLTNDTNKALNFRYLDMKASMIRCLLGLYMPIGATVLLYLCRPSPMPSI